MEPRNYVDLFDLAYPENPIQGFVDPSQITISELNERLSAIRSNIRNERNAIASIAAEASQYTGVQDLIMPYSEVLGSKTFIYDNGDILANTYRQGIDPAGLSFSFDEPRVVFRLNNLGNSILYGGNDTVLVFVNGILLNSDSFNLSLVQGGLIIYLKKIFVEPDFIVKVLILRKFDVLNQCVRKSHVVQYFQSDNSEYTMIFPSSLYKRNTLAIDNRLALYIKNKNEPGFRLVDNKDWGLRVTEDGYGLVVGYKLTVHIGQQFWLIDRAGWLNIEKMIHKDESYVDLTMPDSGPPPLTLSNDLDVWVEGRKLWPERDYTIQHGGHLNSIRLLFSGPALRDFTIRIISNIPYDLPGSLEMSWLELPDLQCVAKLDNPIERLRLIPNWGLLFQGGGINSIYEKINVVIGNFGLHFYNLTGRCEVVYRSRVCLPPDVYAAAKKASSFLTPQEDILSIMGLTPNGVDLVQAYKNRVEAATISEMFCAPLPPFKKIHWAYKWAKDHEENGGVSIDCSPNGHYSDPNWIPPYDGFDFLLGFDDDLPADDAIVDCSGSFTHWAYTWIIDNYGKGRNLSFNANWKEENPYWIGPEIGFDFDCRPDNSLPRAIDLECRIKISSFLEYINGIPCSITKLIYFGPDPERVTPMMATFFPTSGIIENQIVSFGPKYCEPDTIIVRNWVQSVYTNNSTDMFYCGFDGALAKNIYANFSRDENLIEDMFVYFGPR